MTLPACTPRLFQGRVEPALTDTPVVLSHGPRQSGKTTLARHVGKERGFACYRFDDVGVRSAAPDDPAGFVTGLPRRPSPRRAMVPRTMMPTRRVRRPGQGKSRPCDRRSCRCR